MSTAAGSGKKIILLRPRGFCAGVVRAIDVVKIALNVYGAPIYVRKEIVHNRHVVDELRGAGAIFIEELDEVPAGARVIFSAHGVSPAVRAQARERGLQVIDATCPLVTKVHLEAVKFAKRGYTIVLIGHKDHDEVIGTLGEAPESTVLVTTVEDVDQLNLKDPERVSFITQTTLSLDETKDGVDTVAVTAGASAPENLVQELIGSLSDRGFNQLEEMEIKEEDVRFNLPSELGRTARLQ